MRRLIELSRYVVAVPAVKFIVGAFILMVIGTWEIVRSLVKLLDTDLPLKDGVVSILTAVDTLLLATVLLVIGYGLYELFVDASVKLPPWLEIRSLDDLKAKRSSSALSWRSSPWCSSECSSTRLTPTT